MKKSGKNINGEITVDKNCVVSAKATEKNEPDAIKSIEITNIGAGVEIIPSTTSYTVRPVTIRIEATGEKTEYSFDNETWKEDTRRIHSRRKLYNICKNR